MNLCRLSLYVLALITIAGGGVLKLVHGQDVTCGALQNITNGYVTIPTNRSEGSLASYECDEEYTLQGYGTRTCQRDGTWSGEEPRCRRYFPDTFLPFGIEYGDTPVPRRNDGDSNRIFLSTDVWLFGYRQRSLYVNTNGLLSFHWRSGLSSGRGLNFSSISRYGVSIVAPFFDNVDITIGGGNVFYRLISDSENVTLDKVQRDIYTQYPNLGNSRPSLVFLATWDRVAPHYRSGSVADHNTFQVYLASNGTWSIIKFNYGDIEWSTSSTLVGVGAGFAPIHITHPASLNRQALRQLNGTSVLYRIDDDTDIDPVMCSSLHNISNGYVTINPSNRSVGSIATYGCHNNFSLNGNKMRTCQRNGQWTGIEPLCDTTIKRPLPECFLPYGSENGDSALQRRDDDSTYEFIGVNIVLSGHHERLIYVNTNGVISLSRSFISPSGRGSGFGSLLSSPPIIAPFWDNIDITKGGNITYREVSDNNTLQKIHQEISTLYPGLGNVRPRLVFLATWEHVPPNRAIGPSTDRNTFQVYVASNGTWTIVRTCYGVIEWATNSTVIGVSAGDFNAQDYVTHPASLNGQAVKQLSGSTTFYRIDRDLRHVMCSSLSNITNGYVTNPSDRSVGSIASYKCVENFILRSNGTATRICQGDGMWSGEEPRCDSLMCSPLLNITRGTVLIPNPPSTNSVALYQCNQGYTLVGDERRTCLSNRTWSGKQPTCELSPPGEVHGFCSHINWRNNLGVPCGDVIGYQVKLIDPSTRRDVIRKVDNLGTFYALVKDDEEYKQIDTEVQVGMLSHLGSSSIFSKRISLGCKDTVIPTSKPDPSVYFELGGKMYLNNSNISISDIGEGEQALYCKTDKELCCGTVPNRFGQFYYPNGVQVPTGRLGHEFYRNRGEQLIRLNRRRSALSPTGKYRCEIPDASDVLQKIFITLL